MQSGSLQNSDDEEENKLTGRPTTNSTKMSALSSNLEDKNIAENNSHTNLVKSGDGQNIIGNDEVLGSICVESTVPHFECRDTQASTPVGVLHPSMVIEGSKFGVSGCMLSVLYIICSVLCLLAMNVVSASMLGCTVCVQQ